MKIGLFLVLGCLFFSCQHTNTLEREPAGGKLGSRWGKKAVKEYFLNATPEERNEALARAEIFTEAWRVDQVPQVDLVGETQLRCGPDYKMLPAKVQVEDRFSSGDFSSSKTFESYQWSKVSCDYHPDVEKSMGGGSTKFLCDFPDTEAPDSKRTKKVRYASSSSDPLDSEVVESTIASNLARLIGLPTKMFCPARISCKGCPSSNPWRDDRAAKGPGRKTIDFDWALVESTVEAYIISTKVQGNAPNGLNWSELKNVKADSEDERQKKLIEREAWLLWVSFLQQTDAGDFNLRLICLEPEKTQDEKYSCKRPAIYVHDYGHSFYRHLTYSKWAKIPVFSRSDANSGCRLGFNKDELPRRAAIDGIILGAEISAEARDLLLARLSAVSDSQWITLFQMARAEEATERTSAEWLKDVKKKLQNMRSAQCLPFAAGKSVLFKSSP